MHRINMNGWHRSFNHAPRRLQETRLEAEFSVPVRLREGCPRAVRRGRLWFRLKTQHQEHNHDWKRL
jgi:hypothetical protein